MDRWIRVEPNVKVYADDINPRGGKTILFLHGWPANEKMFEYQYNFLVSKGYRCIGLDTRGFGRSDKPVWGYGYDRLADDVRTVIDALQLRNVTLLGHSTGGAIAIRYAARHKAYGLSGLVLCAAAAPSLVQLPDFPYGLPRQTVDNIIASTYKDRPQMLHDFGEIFFYNKVTPSFSDWFFLMGLAAASWSTVAVANTWLTDLLFEDMRCICLPTLIMHGVHDEVVLPPLGQLQHEAIAGSEFIPFENSGHGLFYDEMDKFNNELTRSIG